MTENSLSWHYSTKLLLSFRASKLLLVTKAALFESKTQDLNMFIFTFMDPKEDSILSETVFDFLFQSLLDKHKS